MMKITLKERLQDEAAGVLGYLFMALGAVVVLVLVVGGVSVMLFLTAAAAIRGKFGDV